MYINGLYFNSGAILLLIGVILFNVFIWYLIKQNSSRHPVEFHTLDPDDSDEEDE